MVKVKALVTRIVDMVVVASVWDGVTLSAPRIIRADALTAESKKDYTLKKLFRFKVLVAR